MLILCSSTIESKKEDGYRFKNGTLFVSYVNEFSICDIHRKGEDQMELRLAVSNQQAQIRIVYDSYEDAIKDMYTYLDAKYKWDMSLFPSLSSLSIHKRHCHRYYRYGYTYDDDTDRS